MLDTIHYSDLFELCETLDDDSVDMILCDLPYGVTACEWDVRIPMEPMWEQFKRVIKSRGAIVLTATEPFASMLRMSNLGMYKYDWVWDKITGKGHLVAKIRPLQQHEYILVFGKGAINYNPIMRRRLKSERATEGRRTQIMGGETTNYSVIRFDYYPKTLLTISNRQSIHPTQKPVKLFEYLIKTYTQPGEVVFDPCVGSGTTALAAIKSGRHYICGDSSEEYVEIARQRIMDSDPYQATKIDNTYTQLSLFEA